MPLGFVAINTDAAIGQKLDSIVRAEIDFLAPSTIDSNDIKENMIDTGAVSSRNIADGAVGTSEIAAGAVVTASIANGAVANVNLAAGAVTSAKTGVGVVTCCDVSGNPVQSREMYVTAAQYAAIASPDPSTNYYIIG